MTRVKLQLTKHEVETLKQRLQAYATELGGTVARITYHKQNRYARAFVVRYCTNREIGEIRVYASGRCVALDVPSRRTVVQAVLAETHSPECCFTEEV